MAKNKRLSIRVTDKEKQLLQLIANRLERSQSDVVRIIIKMFAQELKLTT